MQRFKKNLKLIIILVLVLLSACTFDMPSSTESIQIEKTASYKPQPSDKSIDQGLVTTLKWEAENAISYDVYFDSKNPPTTLLAAKLTKKNIVVSNLDYGKNYYWKVVSNFSDGGVIEGPVWSFRTIENINPIAVGYAMILHKQETKLPNVVNFIFQVVDMSNRGVANLQAQDFEVYEDGYPISSESSVEIKKSNQLPFKIKTVLMLDNSASLQYSIDQIREAAANFIRNILPSQEVSIWQFSEEPELLHNFTSDKNALLNSLQNYKLGSNTTNLYGSVVKGASLWEDKFTMDEIVKGSLILFTDGRETTRPTMQARVEALNSVHNKSVYTIGLGSKDQIDEEFLRSVGTAGYFNIQNINELESQFLIIQQKIIEFGSSFYMVNYKSPRRGNQDYMLTIRIKNNPYTGNNSYIIGRYNSSGFY